MIHHLNVLQHCLDKPRTRILLINLGSAGLFLMHAIFTSQVIAKQGRVWFRNILKKSHFETNSELCLVSCTVWFLLLLTEIFSRNICQMIIATKLCLQLNCNSNCVFAQRKYYESHARSYTTFIRKSRVDYMLRKRQ